MEKNNNMEEINEAVSGVDPSEMSQEELKKAMGDFITKERGQAMILGYRIACQAIMQIIDDWHVPGTSKRQYERIFKKVEEFCGKALKQDENNAEETEQN